MKKSTLTSMKQFFEAYAVDNQTAEYKSWVDELTAEIERVEKKAAYVSPSDKAKAERSAVLYNAILEIVAGADSPLDVATIRTKGGFEDSPQKITNVVTRLVNDGKLLRTYDKRKATYTLAEDEAQYLDREVTV